MGISQGRFRAQRAIREELRRVRCAVAQHRDLFAFKRYGPAFATAIRLASTVIAL
jgi:hypothetical protein